MSTAVCHCAVVGLVFAGTMSDVSGGMVCAVIGSDRASDPVAAETVIGQCCSLSFLVVYFVVGFCV